MTHAPLHNAHVIEYLLSKWRAYLYKLRAEKRLY
jgi:hypothetical protein